MESLVIGVDFDGTIVKKVKFPEIGADVPYALAVLLALQENHKLLLWAPQLFLTLK